MVYKHAVEAVFHIYAQCGEDAAKRGGWRPCIKWASLRENLSSGGLRITKAQTSLCESACTPAQSDQCLCYSFFGKKHISTCYRGNFNIPASL